jgi:hypothetical protein
VPPDLALEEFARSSTARFFWGMFSKMSYMEM